MVRDVFVSYSQPDREVAFAIVSQLEGHGISAWIAPRDVAPSSVWAEQIMDALSKARLLVLVFSSHSNDSVQVSREVERAVARRIPVLPFRIEDVPPSKSLEYFLSSQQWLDAFSPPREPHYSALCAHAAALLKDTPTAHTAPLPAARTSGSLQYQPRRSVPAAARARRKVWYGGIVVAAALLLGVACFLVQHFRAGAEAQPAKAAAAEHVPSIAQPAAVAFTPPPRSVAVLSFVNLSGDAKDEYFSDGLSEELLNTLVRLEGLQVAARASSFSFKGKDVDILTMGRKLNVGAILEGSVRKAGPRVRITAQLENAVSGFQLWSQTYDREFKDILALQTEIATAVTEALKVRLLREDREKLRDTGTNDPKAFDAYLRGRSARVGGDEQGLRAAIAAFDEAIALDPKYALAHARHAEASASWANDWVRDAARRKVLFAGARREAEDAASSAPSSGQASAALATVLGVSTVDYRATDRAWRRAVELEPGNGELLGGYAFFAARMQHADAEQSAQRALALSPLDPDAHRTQGMVLFYQRRFDDARPSFRQALVLQDSRQNRFWTAWNELAAGNLDEPIRVCESDADSWYAQNCLAIAYHRQGRRAEAEKMLARMQREQGELSAAQYAGIYAQWNQVPAALQWLEKAYALQDAGLDEIKVDPFLDPIRNEPRFNEIVRRLDFPK